VRLGSLWDLKCCRQKQGESLWDYIWRFSQMCHELPKICDANVISVFWSRMNCRTLVHDLNRDQPKTTKELLNIATKYASSEEAVGVVFVHGVAKAAPNSG
jgi:hypothetical protein